MRRRPSADFSPFSDFFRAVFAQGYVAMLVACSGNSRAVPQQQASGGVAPIATSSSGGGSALLQSSSGGVSSVNSTSGTVAVGGTTQQAGSTVSVGGRSTAASGGASAENSSGATGAAGGGTRTSPTGGTSATSSVGAGGSSASSSAAAGGTKQSGGTTNDTRTSQTGGTFATSSATAGGTKQSGGATVGGAFTGGTSTGGTTGSGTAGSGATDAFTLAWQDDFNTLDSNRWAAQNFTYDTNLATFTPNNVSVNNGVLTIALTANSSNSTKPYWGVELRSAQTLTYGKLSARMRFAKGSGVVSGLVLFYTPYPNCDWNEIDIEHLGNSSNSSQLNAMVYTGTIVPNCTTSVSPTQDPLVVDLGFNAETDFHQYDVEWTPASVRYLADGKLLRTWTKNINQLKEPLTVLLTIWASSSASWAGAVNSSTAPTSAEIDWIKAYSWNG